jgi:hypothetical protein
MPGNIKEWNWPKSATRLEKDDFEEKENSYLFRSIYIDIYIYLHISKAE